MRTLFVYCTPFALTVWILLAGAALLWRPHRQRLGRWLITIGVVSLALQSMTPIGSRLLGRLEFMHPAVAADAPDLPERIVVLGGGVNPTPGLPLVSQLSPSSLERLVEAVRWYHRNPDRRLLISGGGGEAKPEAEVMAQLARQLGVPAEAIEVESETFNTGEQAIMLRHRLGDEPFVLITSAAHMPRSLAAVEALGLRALPVPVGHQVYEPGSKQTEGLGSLIGPPHPAHPLFLQQVAYETIGHWRTQWQLRRTRRSGSDGTEDAREETTGTGEDR